MTADDMSRPVAPGDAVVAQDAFGEWLPMVALTGVEPTHIWRDGHMRKVHDFPVIWVAREGVDERIPWPADDVVRRETSP